MLRPVKMTWKELCGGVHTGLRHRLPLATVATLSVSVKYEHLHTVIGIGLC